MLFSKYTFKYFCSDDDDMDPSEMQRLLTTVLWDKVNGPSNSVQNGRENGETPAHEIFDNVCLMNLSNNCFTFNCKYRHHLPNKSVVQTNLEAATIDIVNEAYKDLLSKHERLLVEYFSVFCSYYGRQKKREQLRRMICLVANEMYIEHNFLKEIVNGFVLSDIDFATAVDIVVNETQDSVELADEIRFELVWELFVNNHYVCDEENVLLTQLTNFGKQILDDNIVLNYEAINALLQLEQLIDVEETRDYFLREILGKCSINTLKRIDESILSKYLKEIKMLGANHVQMIRQKCIVAGMNLDSSN